ncbi:hypothetical protein ACQE3E_14525 [Methylomonas sp. MED-D]|uniref:hypothetical protein n=1 Tax=unclassified Methylomonas TaxID=2608980 RepID=UPI0008DA18BD|nr:MULTISPECIES: hypothetical protein [unclassified Methylomonas]MDT4331364.1 hypothetical protein [Methylomonas sp. MV1]NJA05435.1 hypothetical protein [Methylococcaceae bacterium WWC4]OHX36074.1 hypothetical protein BJL95_09765 [Methylomonas sp. LWB]WGS84503.1 hypothetical protein QC632_15755 [Methylomonas sp. UP202]
MKFSVLVRRLSHPQVRRRLKIGLSIWAIAIAVSVVAKLAYDIGYFKAQSMIDEKNAAAPATRSVLTLEYAQRIVSGALNEDPNNPKTVVSQVVDNNPRLATIVVENNKQKKIAWIFEMRLFFVGDLLNDQGYNLTEAIERQQDMYRNNR